MTQELFVKTRSGGEFQRHPSIAVPKTDGGYGWIVTISVAMVNGHSWGISATYSVFLAHYLKEDTFTGATALMYAAVGSLSIGTTLLISPLVTVLARKVGTRPAMLLGAVLQSTGLVCASFSTKIWHLFLSQGFLFGVGMGLLFLPSCGIVSQWFTKRCALANGIAIAGAGLGGFAYSLIVGAMIRTIGLGWAYRTLAIVSVVVNTACILLIRTRYEATQARRIALDTTLLKKTGYLLILGFGAFSMLGYFILIFTLANYANVIGLRSSQASMIPALFMLGQALGRPGIGWLSDRFGRLNVTLLMTFSTAVLSFIVWLNAKSLGTLILFALAVGIPAGVFWVNAAPIIVDVMGMEHLSSGLSMLWLVMVLPSMFSSPIALGIFTGTGSYVGAQLFTGFMFIAASLCMLTLRGWQISRRDIFDEELRNSHEKNYDGKKNSGTMEALASACFRWGII